MNIPKKNYEHDDHCLQAVYEKILGNSRIYANVKFYIYFHVERINDPQAVIFLKTWSAGTYTSYRPMYTYIKSDVMIDFSKLQGKLP